MPLPVGNKKWENFRDKKVLYKSQSYWYDDVRKVWCFEVVDFVPTTRRWYGQGRPERCRRGVRLPEQQPSKGLQRCNPFPYFPLRPFWSNGFSMLTGGLCKKGSFIHTHSEFIFPYCPLTISTVYRHRANLAPPNTFRQGIQGLIDVWIAASYGRRETWIS